MQRAAILRHQGTEHPVMLHALSRYGALVGVTESVGVGARVELIVELAEGRVTVSCHIASRIDLTRAARLGIAPGIAIRFDPNSVEAGARLAAAVAAELAAPAPTRPARATRKLIPPVLSALLTASRIDDGKGRRIFEGRLSAATVIDLFSFLERTERSGKLLLSHRNRSATVEFVRGAITGATASWGGSQRAVLFEVIDWPDGEFSLYLSSQSPPIRGRGTRVTYLLLEHARHRDDAARMLLERAPARRAG